MDLLHWNHTVPMSQKKLLVILKTGNTAMPKKSNWVIRQQHTDKFNTDVFFFFFKPALESPSQGPTTS